MNNDLVQKINNLLPGNTMKILTVGSPLLMSVGALCYSLEQASQGNTRNAIVGGVLHFINAYAAGYQSSRIMEKK